MDRIELLIVILVSLWALFKSSYDQRNNSELKFELLAKGSSPNNFLDIISRNERSFCYGDQFWENFKLLVPEKLLTKNETTGNGEKKRPPLQLNCLKRFTKGRSEFEIRAIYFKENFAIIVRGGVKILNSLKEIDEILIPEPAVATVKIEKTKQKLNETNEEAIKRRILAIAKPGSCVAILFYGTSCMQSKYVGDIFVKLPAYYPDIKFGAIDAFKFDNVSNYFNIISVPAVLLFHQGLPHYSFTNHVDKIFPMINMVTNIDPFENPLFISDMSLRNEFQSKTDYYLYLAWFFIAICAIWYFINSKYYPTLMEILKRNWRESGAGSTHDEDNASVAAAVAAQQN